MRDVRFTAFVLMACSVMACAEGAVEVRVDGFRPDGRPNVVVSNHSASSVAAYAYRVTFSASVGPERSVDVFQDSLLSPASLERPIDPGQVISLAGPQAPSEHGEPRTVAAKAEFGAAILGDHSEIGDPAWIAKIRDRRVFLVQVLDAQLAVLRSALTQARRGNENLEPLLNKYRADEAGWLSRYPDADRQSLVRSWFERLFADLNRTPPEGRLRSRLGRALQPLQMRRDSIAVIANDLMPAPSPGVLHTWAGVTAPTVIQRVEPEATPQARSALLDGAVTLYAEIGVDGLAHNVQVLITPGMGLEKNAMNALSKWRFKPGMKDGKPVPVAATLQFWFGYI